MDATQLAALVAETLVGQLEIASTEVLSDNELVVAVELYSGAQYFLPIQEA